MVLGSELGERGVEQRGVERDRQRGVFARTHLLLSCLTNTTLSSSYPLFLTTQNSRRTHAHPPISHHALHYSTFLLPTNSPIAHSSNPESLPPLPLSPLSLAGPCAPPLSLAEPCASEIVESGPCASKSASCASNIAERGSSPLVGERKE